METARVEISSNNNKDEKEEEENGSSPRWFDVEGVPDAYMFPQQLRPGDSHINNNHQTTTFPVIDLARAKRTDAIKQIIHASQRFGVFQVINHGFSEKVMSESVSVLKEFFSLEAKDKESKSGWLYMSSTDYAKDGVYLWRDNVKLPCHPLQECMQRWPQKPSKYREVMAEYIEETGRLSTMILELITEGLGLEADYLVGRSEVQLLSANKYPPCPDPRLTLGLLRHKDPSFITILYQGTVPGLQVFDLDDGDRCFLVLPLPNAFVINLGNQLEVVSNGKLRSPEHRVVTNKERERTTIATFINPRPSCIVEPAKALIDHHSNPPLFQPTLYKDFVYSTQAFGLRTDALQFTTPTATSLIQ